VPRDHVVVADSLTAGTLHAAGWGTDLDDTLVDLDLDDDCMLAIGYRRENGLGFAGAVHVFVGVVPPTNPLPRLFRPPRRARV
jgi:hypothetical protein